MVLKQVDTHVQRIKLDPCFTLYTKTNSNGSLGLHMVAHAYNPSFSGSKHRRITVGDQHRKKVRLCLKTQTRCGLDSRQAEIGGLQSDANKKHETLSEKQIKAKRAGSWLEW
jgi:hypothetical protein